MFGRIRLTLHALALRRQRLDDDDATFLRAIEPLSWEWDSPEDDDAFRDL